MRRLGVTEAVVARKRGEVILLLRVLIVTHARDLDAGLFADFEF
jgi:hypothetical protein